jgi:hypothetical protein
MPDDLATIVWAIEPHYVRAFNETEPMLRPRSSSFALARAAHVHAHGSGYLPDAHHPQVHALNSHTGTADDINAWAQASAGGGAAGVKVWVGTTDPGASAVEGDIWVKK